MKLGCVFAQQAQWILPWLTRREGFVAVAKTTARVGRLKRIWTTLHYISLNSTALRHTIRQVQLQLQLQLQLPTTALATRLQLHYATLDYSAVHCATPQVQLQLHYSYNHNYNYHPTTTKTTTAATTTIAILLQLRTTTLH